MAFVASGIATGVAIVAGGVAVAPAVGEALGLGGGSQLTSTGRNVAENLKEQVTMHLTQSDPDVGRVFTKVVMSDPRWLASDGWVKMQQTFTTSENVTITIHYVTFTIHYVYNTLTGVAADFKFK